MAPERQEHGTQCALPLRLRSGVVGEAASLLAQADRCLGDAEHAREADQRFAAAYLAALRAAAAILVSHGHPHRGRRRPRSVWVLLRNADHELAEWAEFFAAHSNTHAAAQAGRTSRVTFADAAELFEQAWRFVLLARRTVGQRSASPSADATRPGRHRPASSNGHRVSRKPSTN